MSFQGICFHDEGLLKEQKQFFLEYIFHKARDSRNPKYLSITQGNLLSFLELLCDTIAFVFKNQHFLFLITKIMYWILPVVCFPGPFETKQQAPQPVEREQVNVQRAEGDHGSEWQPNTTFKGLFKKQLQKRQERKPKKVWTVEQDQILLNLRKEGRSWLEISSQVSNGSQVKCKRRHERLTKELQKWPKQIDRSLKMLHQENGFNWQQLRDYICQNFKRSYSLKSIRERYVNSLRDGIDKNPWNFQEDLRLLGSLCKYGREWQIVASHFPTRSERHIKNRFSCTLEPVLKKIRKRKCFKQLGEEIQNLIRTS